jgi:nuclear transport factor 2 (NTF2) superfamily protein
MNIQRPPLPPFTLKTASAKVRLGATESALQYIGWRLPMS